MKRFHLLFGVAALAIMSGCEKKTINEEPLPDPVISLISEDPVQVPYTGGSVTVSYEIENPAENGKISATPSDGWISDADCSSENKIILTAEENKVNEERSATVTIRYSYGQGKYIETVAEIKQEANPNEPEPPQIKMKVQEVTVPAEGGLVELSYEIINPVDGGKLIAESETEWISNLFVDDTSVAFKVSANTGSEERTGEVVLTYSYDDKSVELKMPVIQEIPASGAEPQIETKIQEVTVPAEGGLIELSYEIINPVDGGMLNAASDAGWISNFYVDDTSVAFRTSENTGSQERTGEVVLTYSYDGKSVELKITVIQEAPASGDTPQITTRLQEVTVPAEGGFIELSYEIINPVTGGMMNASSDAGWLSNFYVDDTSIAFRAAENTDSEERTGEVVLTYSYNGESVELIITVIQEAPASGDTPQITTKIQEVIVPAKGGLVELSYEIINPVTGGMLNASSGTGWLSNFYVDDTSVAFRAAENTGTEERLGDVVLTYSYDGKSVELIIFVIQEAAV